MQEQDSGNRVSRLEVRDDLIFRQLDEEWVVYDSAGEKLHVFNASAALVWVHCTGDYSVDEIVHEINTAYGGRGEREQIEKDVRQTIREFADMGFLL